MTTLLILFFGSLLGIGVIVGRHASAVFRFEPKHSPELRQEQLKERLLLVQSGRLVRSWFSTLGTVCAPLLAWARSRFHGSLARLHGLTREYEKASLSLKGQEQQETTGATLTRLLEEAKTYQNEERFDDAEQKYLAAIALDPKALPAYEGLGELYFTKKAYDEARETFQHVVKLNERNAEAHARLGAIASATGNLQEAEEDYHRALTLSHNLVSAHLDLGEVHRTLEKHDEALQNFLDARELEPKNPRILDALLETAIILDKVKLAQDVLKELEEVNPGNQKIGEFQERLLAVRAERRRRRQEKDTVGP